MNSAQLSSPKVVGVYRTAKVQAADTFRGHNIRVQRVGIKSKLFCAQTRFLCVPKCYCWWINIEPFKVLRPRGICILNVDIYIYCKLNRISGLLPYCTPYLYPVVCLSRNRMEYNSYFIFTHTHPLTEKKALQAPHPLHIRRVCVCV